jgi:hypothetical protein
MSGPDLVKSIMAQFPGASIEEVLDKARKAAIERYVTELKSTEPLEIIHEALKWNLAREDLASLLQNFPQAEPPLEIETAWSIYQFLSKIPKVPEPRTGCFCFRGSSPLS